MKPLKSACFDFEQKKAPLSSSLKERIKLNKVLTFSPKTGKLIGIAPKVKQDNLMNAGYVSNNIA